MTTPTENILTELQLYGCRLFQDERDPSSMPNAQIAADSVDDIFDALAVALGENRAGEPESHHAVQARGDDIDPDFEVAERVGSSRRSRAGSGARRDRWTPRSGRTWG